MIKYKELDYCIKGVAEDRVMLKPTLECKTKAILDGRRLNPSFKIIKNRNGLSIQIEGRRTNITEDFKNFIKQYEVEI